jgi:hypothetical protein
VIPDPTPAEKLAVDWTKWSWLSLPGAIVALIAGINGGGKPAYTIAGGFALWGAASLMLVQFAKAFAIGSFVACLIAGGLLIYSLFKKKGFFTIKRRKK